MTLRDLFGPEQPPVPVGALALDDRRVEPGTVFFCVPGFTRDGHDFAAAAVARGAAALVVDHVLDGVGTCRRSWWTTSRGDGARRRGARGRSRPPAAGRRDHGHERQDHLRPPPARPARGGGAPDRPARTVSSIVGGVEAPTIRTTPEALELQPAFAAMLAAGDTHCVMEVSSHALELRRADAIHWAAVGLHEPLPGPPGLPPGHGELLRRQAALLVAPGTPRRSSTRTTPRAAPGARVPRRDHRGPRAGRAVRATDVEVALTGSRFTVDGRRMATTLPGRFNVVNALGAVALARALGVDDDVIAEALPRAGRVPGRFEPVDAGQDFAVLVDYAHTPDGLENVLTAARGLAGSHRVIAVFGAGGDRDRGKRPLMGAAAAALADHVVVTSDNPRSEDPEAIVAEVLAGAPGADAIVDRREAIAHAVGLARAGDVVVVAGKGHEQGQELAGGEKVPFDDVTVVREALDARVAA
jgi:UDP-N-acetylmuramoyl-L-alanyl-D-glutamate--2,6-diaminopimelate ligase